jgi:hypothetical protein
MKSLHFWTDGESMTRLLLDFTNQVSSIKWKQILIDAAK